MKKPAHEPQSKLQALINAAEQYVAMAEIGEASSLEIVEYFRDIFESALSIRNE